MLCMNFSHYFVEKSHKRLRKGEKLRCKHVFCGYDLYLKYIFTFFSFFLLL